jgi:hypothetical protein
MLCTVEICVDDRLEGQIRDGLVYGLEDVVESDAGHGAGLLRRLWQKKNNALGPLCHALALTEIGLDPAAVRAWAVERPPAFRRNWYFAEAGLIDHVDPNDRSSGAKAAPSTAYAQFQS